MGARHREGIVRKPRWRLGGCTNRPSARVYPSGRPSREDFGRRQSRRFAMDKKAKTPKKPKQPKTGADKKKAT
jgi:hypothetical protein